jgi:ABC-type multidrug transport system permease subunit
LRGNTDDDKLKAGFIVAHYNFINHEEEHRMDEMYNGNDQNGMGDSYQQPVQEQLQYQYQQPQTDLEEPVSMGEWLITMLILMIPCVNLVMMFVWAFSSKEKKSKSNYFKASLIFAAVILVLYIIIIAIFGAAFASAISGAAYY